jgi:hypothetical protein
MHLDEPKGGTRLAPTKLLMYDVYEHPREFGLLNRTHHTQAKMPEVTRDTIPLSDEKAVKAIIAALGLKPYHPETLTPHPSQDAAPPWESTLMYWQRYFYRGQFRPSWKGKTDIWLTVDEDEDVLRRVVITGLEDEQTAKRLRYEFTFRGRVDADIERLVQEDAATRELRQYQTEFQGHLEYVRDYFKWEGTEVVESDGRILPISRSSLTPDDIKLLREVFARLPATRLIRVNKPRVKVQEARCETCGERAETKRSPVTDLSGARKRVAALATDFGDETFEDWQQECVAADRPDAWTRSSELYSSYLRWIANREVSRPEKTELRRTALTQKRWGDLMHKQFDRRRDGKGNLYRVRLKRVA